jgi:hypothetical protein
LRSRKHRYAKNFSSFVHSFFEDLTHYENAFLKTIKNLLFKPATLTSAYLSGKRLSYLAPVPLYFLFHYLFFNYVFPNSDSITSNSTDDKAVAQSVNEELIKVVVTILS